MREAKKSARPSLLAACPAVASEWDNARNGALTPANVTPGSGRKVWWRCKRDPTHVWCAAIANRARGSGCPACAGKLATPSTSLRARFPAIAAEWHPDKNGALTPDAVTASSGKRCWWSCRTCGHAWPAQVSHRTARGDGCPACSGRVSNMSTCLATVHPRLAAEWHPKKNGALLPTQVLPGSKRRAWWRCTAKAAHVWQATIVSRAHLGAGCPMCAGRVATAATALSALFPAVAAEWHPTKNGALRPDKLTAGSHRKVWWRCSADGSHEWQARVAHRARAGSGCPMCAHQVVTPATSLRAQYPDLARQWHPTKNEKLSPDDVVPGSGRRVWWRCPLNRHHEWVAPVNARARKGRGCPICRGLYGPKRKSSKRARLRGPTLT